MKCVYLFLLFISINSCFNNDNRSAKALKGIWKISDAEFVADTDITHLILDKDTFRALNDLGVSTPFSFLQKGKIKFHNCDSILTIDIDKDHSIIKLNSVEYIKQPEAYSDSIFEVNLTHVNKASLLKQTLDRTKRQYFISVNTDGIRLNGIKATIEDIPLFLDCYHCETITKEAILIIDKNLSIAHLKEVLLPLFVSNIRSIKIATHIQFICPQIKTVNNRLNIWEEGILSSNFQHIPRPPVAPNRSRSQVISNSNISILSPKTEINQIIEQLNQNLSAVIISIDKNMRVQEYLDIQQAVYLFFNTQKDSIAISQYQSAFESLNSNEKKKVLKSLTIPIFEIANEH